MPEYELRLRFTAADGSQASRLAEAWADTCAAEYGTKYAGVERIGSHITGCLLPEQHLGSCTTTITPAREVRAGSQPSTHPVDLSAGPDTTATGT